MGSYYLPNLWYCFHIYIFVYQKTVNYLEIIRFGLSNYFQKKVIHFIFHFLLFSAYNQRQLSIPFLNAASIDFLTRSCRAESFPTEMQNDLPADVFQLDTFAA